jgi:hypothetical protein
MAWLFDNEIIDAYIANLVSIWQMEDVSDPIGGNDLTNVNSVGFISGKNNNAGEFVRESEKYLSIADAEQVGLDPSGSFTISCWVYLDSLNIYQDIITKFNSTGDQRSFFCRVSNGNKIQFYLSTDGISWKTVDSSNSISNGAWYHVVIRFTASSSIAVFLNNTKTQNTTSIPATMYNGTAGFLIGSNETGETTENWLDGNIDEVYFWNTALSDSAIAALYNSGTGLFISDIPQPVQKSTNLVYSYDGYTTISKLTNLIYSYDGYTSLSKFANLIYNYNSPIRKLTNLIYNYNSPIRKLTNLIYNYHNRLRVLRTCVYDYLPRTPQAMWIEPSPDFANDAAVLRWKYNLPDGWNADRLVPMLIFLNGKLYGETYDNYLRLSGFVGLTQEVYIWAKVRPGQSYTGISPRSIRAKINFDVVDGSDIVKVEIFTDHGNGTIILDDVYGTVDVESEEQHFGKVNIFNRFEITV